MQSARFLRLGKAHTYLGMCKAVFQRDVRPFVTEIPIGARGVAFDRLELDQWADRHKQSKGKNTNTSINESHKTWQRKASPASTSVARSGISTSRSQDMDDFAAARARATTRRPKHI